MGSMDTYASGPAAPRGALGRHRYAITRGQLEDPEAHAPRACKAVARPHYTCRGAVSQLYAALCAGVLMFVPL
jgi:hypothetical protein